MIQLFEKGANPDNFEASLRPDDIMAKTLLSRKVDVRHILLKVSVPKRTGRKRKRGTDEPFVADDSEQASVSNHVEAKAMLQSLRDNNDIASVEVVGKIGETHRFRNMPDFQYATSTNTLMQNLRGSIFTTDLPSIRDFKYDKSRSLAEGQDVGPPPFFSVVKQPYNWSYKQNPYVKTFVDAEGNIKVANTTAPIKHIRQNIDPDSPFVPFHPPGELMSLETAQPKIKSAVKQLKSMFDERPLMQRRVFINKFKGKQSENELKAAVGYCGYAFTSGPWRDTVIKFGIDPRKDPKYRIYQTVTYQLMEDGKGAADDPGSYIRKVGGKRVTMKRPKVEHSHIFDGRNLYRDGKVWQACDVSDPMLKGLLDNAELRTEPDVSLTHDLSSARVLTNMTLDGLLWLVRQRHLGSLPPHHEIQDPVPRFGQNPRRRNVPRSRSHVPHLHRRQQRAPHTHRSRRSILSCQNALQRLPD